MSEQNDSIWKIEGKNIRVERIIKRKINLYGIC